MKPVSQQYELVFLNLLHSALWGAKYEVQEDFEEWEDLIRLSRDQSVLGMIAKVILLNRSQVDHLPTQLRLKLKSFVVSNVMVNDKMKKIIASVFGALRENDIPAILLKGYGLSVNYPYPQLRQNGDIDIYIGEELYLDSYRVLKKLADEIDSETTIWKSKHYHATIDEVVVEVHRFCEVLPIKRYNRFFQSFAFQGMSESISISESDIDVKIPEVTFNSLYILVHLFSHFMTEGVGIRQLCDWTMHLSKNWKQINVNMLADMLDKLNIRRAWNIFAEISVTYLGYPEDSMPLYEGYDDKTRRRAEIVLEMILKEGNFGHASPYYQKKISGFFLRKLYSISWHIRRDFKLFRIFPDYTLGYFTYILRRGASSISDHFRKSYGR